MLPSPPTTLFVACRYPSALGSGTQIRAAALVRMLAARERVHLFFITSPGHGLHPRDLEMEQACADVVCLQIVGPENAASSTAGAMPGPASVPGMTTFSCPPGKVSAEVASYARRHGIERLFVTHLESAVFVADGLDDFSLRLLDLDELPSRREERIVQLGGPVDTARGKRILLSRLLEKKLLPRFHHVLVSSQIEAELLRERGLRDDAHELPNIRAVLPARRAPLDLTARDLLFVGNFDYLPNVDAAVWFQREIFPLLRAADPSLVFHLVGCGHSPALEALAFEAGVRLAGFQPDLVPCYAGAALAVVPLRSGAGTRIKILEAFGYGRPVVSTTIGAEGLHVTNGENILLADTPGEFAAACRRLLDDPGLAEKLVRGGERLCAERYSPAALARAYEKVFET